MKLTDVKTQIDTFFKNTSSDEIIKHLESQGFEFEDITELLESMKVEHLTITGSSSIRDTIDILPRTMAHFAHLEKHPKLCSVFCELIGIQVSNVFAMHPNFTLIRQK